MGFICDETANVQARGGACRGCVNAGTAEALCQFVFHEKDDIMFDPYSDPHGPIFGADVSLCIRITLTDIASDFVSGRAICLHAEVCDAPSVVQSQ